MTILLDQKVDAREGVLQGVLADNDNVGMILTLLQGAKRIAVDTETSGLNVRNRIDYCMGVCVYTPDIAAYLPFRHKSRNLDRRYFDYLWSILCRTPELDWHHRKFDMHSLATMGVDPLDLQGRQFDTQMAFHLWNEELPSKALDWLSKRFLGIGKHQGDTIKQMGLIYGFANMDVDAYRTYGPQDSWCTWRLRDFVEPKIKKVGLDKVYWETEAPFTELLYLMEQRGVGVNASFCEDNIRIGNGRMGTIRRAVDFDPASTLDLKKFFLDELNLPVLAHTATCQPCRNGAPLYSHEWRASFNKRVMAEYDIILSEMNNPKAKLVSEFRGWQKAVTSLYVPLVEKRGPDGLIRTEFKQHGTVTGRLSASNPNLQQIPRSTDKPWNGNAKSAFHSGRGSDFILYGWDYSQLELRLAASYGREHVLLSEFEKDDADPFAVLAPLVFGELTPENRYHVKNGLVYPSIYGAGLATVAVQLNRSTVEAKPIYDRYKASIPGITEISERVREVVKQRGWIRYWDGRIRHIRNPADVHTRAFNSVLQGGASQLVKKAMIRIREFEDENFFQVLQVHDEIVAVVRRSMLHEYEPLVIKAMTDFPQFPVRFAVQGKEWK